MCLVFFDYEQNPQYRMVIASNRDEFYARPTRHVQFWEEYSFLLAGKDLQAGGTWLGITVTGRIAFLTAYRETSCKEVDKMCSRGFLVRDFLCATESASAYLNRINPNNFNGFNLVVGDASGLYYYSNREGRVRHLSPGLYGLSNHLLDTPWPKVQFGKREFRAILSSGESEEIMAQAIWRLLRNADRADDRLLPHTGVGLEKERMLSPIFIRSTLYGTRSSTIVFIRHSGDVTFLERTYKSGTNGEHSEDIALVPKQSEGTEDIKYQFVIDTR